MKTVPANGLKWGTTLLSSFLQVRNRFLKPTSGRPSLNNLWVEVEMAQKELQIEVGKFQTNYDRMKLELEEEVNNNEEHNKSIVLL